MEADAPRIRVREFGSLKNIELKPSTAPSLAPVSHPVPRNQQSIYIYPSSSSVNPNIIFTMMPAGSVTNSDRLMPILSTLGPPNSGISNVSFPTIVPRHVNAQNGNLHSQIILSTQPTRTTFEINPANPLRTYRPRPIMSKPLLRNARPKRSQWLPKKTIILTFKSHGYVLQKCYVHLVDCIKTIYNQKTIEAPSTSQHPLQSVRRPVTMSQTWLIPCSHCKGSKKQKDLWENVVYKKLLCLSCLQINKHVKVAKPLNQSLGKFFNHVRDTVMECASESDDDEFRSILHSFEES